MSIIPARIDQYTVDQTKKFNFILEPHKKGNYWVRIYHHSVGTNFYLNKEEIQELIKLMSDTWEDELNNAPVIVLEGVYDLAESPRWVTHTKTVPTYSVGQKFYLREREWEGEIDKSDVYMIAQLKPNKVSFISLTDGSRWDKPVRVNNVYTIYQCEFDKLNDDKNFLFVPLTPEEV